MDLGESLLSPARRLNQRPKAPDALIPAQLARIDSDARVLLITRHESAGKACAEPTHARHQRARDVERRL
jgi:hypothetical protein